LGNCLHEFVQPPVEIKRAAYTLNKDVYEFPYTEKYNLKIFYIAYISRKNGLDDKFDNLNIYPFKEKKCDAPSGHHILYSIKNYFNLTETPSVSYLKCENLNHGLYDSYFLSKYGKIRIKHDNSFVTNYINYDITQVKFFDFK